MSTPACSSAARRVVTARGLAQLSVGSGSRNAHRQRESVPQVSGHEARSI